MVSAAPCGFMLTNNCSPDDYVYKIKLRKVNTFACGTIFFICDPLCAHNYQMQAVKQTQRRLDFKSLEILEVEDSGEQDGAAITFRSVLPCAFSKIVRKGTQGYRFVHHSGAAAALS